MDIGKFVTWAVVAAVGYGAYKYLSTGDVSVIPPTQQVVTDLVTQAKAKPNETLRYAAGATCTRSGGGYVKGVVYSCEYKVFKGRSTYNTPESVGTVLVEKKNGEWRIKQ